MTQHVGRGETMTTQPFSLCEPPAVGLHHGFPPQRTRDRRQTSSSSDLKGSIRRQERPPYDAGAASASLSRRYPNSPSKRREKNTFNWSWFVRTSQRWKSGPLLTYRIESGLTVQVFGLGIIRRCRITENVPSRQIATTTLSAIQENPKTEESSPKDFDPDTAKPTPLPRVLPIDLKKTASCTRLPFWLPSHLSQV